MFKSWVTAGATENVFDFLSHKQSHWDSHLELLRRSIRATNQFFIVNYDRMVFPFRHVKQLDRRHEAVYFVVHDELLGKRVEFGLEFVD